MWVFPVPLLPTAITFSRRAMYSQRASSSTNVLLSEGICEVEAIEAFHRREPSLLDAALDHPSFTLDQFEFGQPQQITRVVHPFSSALLGDLVVFTQERRQPERFQVMREQDLGRVAHNEASARRPR